MKERDGKVNDLEKVLQGKAKENQKLLDQLKQAEKKNKNDSELTKKTQEFEATLNNKQEALTKATEELTLAQKLQSSLKQKVDDEVKEA